MKKYTVDEPEFNKTLIITETTDTGHADNINKAPEMAFENTLYLEKTKLDADGGDISEAVIKAADEIEDDEYPIPASGDKPRTFLGKTKKFLGNIKDWMTGVCLLGQIVNNCVTDNAKLPLSAAQGKALMDLYNVLNTNDQNIKKQLNGWRFETTTNIADFNQTNVSNVNRVLIGIINLTGYISFDINWIRLQFQCTGDDAVYCRIIYGSHTSAKWIKIA